MKWINKYLITGKNADDPAWLNRLLWWVFGWCELLDGLTMVISAGYLCFDLSYAFSKWRIARRLGIK